MCCLPFFSQGRRESEGLALQLTDNKGYISVTKNPVKEKVLPSSILSLSPLSQHTLGKRDFLGKRMIVHQTCQVLEGNTKMRGSPVCHRVEQLV